MSETRVICPQAMFLRSVGTSIRERYQIDPIEEVRSCNVCTAEGRRSISDQRECQRLELVRTILRGELPEPDEDTTPPQMGRDTTVLGGIAVPTTSPAFFRAFNVAYLARHFAPQRVRENPGSTFTVAEIGCSTGKETYSIASSLAAAGLRRFLVEGFDVNPHVLAETSGPYRATPFQFEDRMHARGFDGIAMGHFVRPSPELVQPTDILRRHVRFTERDLRRHPLEQGRYDAALANNLLVHTVESSPVTARRIIGNIAVGLKPGGILLSEELAYFDRFLDTLDRIGVQVGEDPALPGEFILRRSP